MATTHSDEGSNPKRKLIATKEELVIPKKLKISNPRYICGIDVGLRNLGLCMAPLDNDMDELPYMEHSSIYINSEGLGYRGWKEKNAVEMVYNWVRDRWENIFSKCDIVLIEKQMEKRNQKNQRSCIIVEQCLKTIFHCHIPLGGPRYFIVGPTWAKNRMGIPYNGTHAQNKAKSVKTFVRRYGKDELDKLAVRFGAKIDDCIDALWIALAGRSDLETVYKELKKISHHEFVHNPTRTTISSKSRNIPIQPLTTPPKEELSLHEREMLLRKELRNAHIKKHYKKQSRRDYT